MVKIVYAKSSGVFSFVLYSVCDRRIRVDLSGHLAKICQSALRKRYRRDGDYHGNLPGRVIAGVLSLWSVQHADQKPF